MGSARFRIHASPQGWAFSLVAPNHRVMALSARPGPDVATVLVWIDTFREQAGEGTFEIVPAGRPGEWIWRLRTPAEIAVCPSPSARRIDATKAAHAVRRAAAVADVRVPAGTPLSGPRAGGHRRPRPRDGGTSLRLAGPAPHAGSAR